MKKFSIAAVILLLVSTMGYKTLSKILDETVAYIHFFDENALSWSDPSESSLSSQALSLSEQAANERTYLLCPYYGPFAGEIMGGSCYELIFNESFEKCTVSFMLYDEKLIFEECPVYGVTAYKGETSEKISIIIDTRSMPAEDLDRKYEALYQSGWKRSELPSLYIINMWIKKPITIPASE
jgi:hypothetical protein